MHPTSSYFPMLQNCFNPTGSHLSSTTAHPHLDLLESPCHRQQNNKSPSSLLSPQNMPGNLVNNKKSTAMPEPRCLRTSSQPTQQTDPDTISIHTPAEALNFLLVINHILTWQPFSYNNLATALLHIAEAQKIPKPWRKPFTPSPFC